MKKTNFGAAESMATYILVGPKFKFQITRLKKSWKEPISLSFI